MKTIHLIPTCLLLALSTLNLQPSSALAQPVTKIAAGQFHSLFLKSDGSLWAMGYNWDGELGDGTRSNTNRPEQIVTRGVAAIAGGGFHSLFLKSDGSLWAMGDNYYGQLGDGTYTDSDRPEQIVASGVTAIAAGYGHSLFLKSDGSLWGMGYNWQGQLGDGSSSYWCSNRPEQIVASNVTAIAAAWWQSLFLKSDGSLWAMGDNESGQLGDGTYNNTCRPEQIVAGNVTAIAGGNQHSLFLKNDGSLWAMGNSGNGQLGDGTTGNNNRPEQIVASGVTAIAAGELHSLFVKNDGSLWAVGFNAEGELGDGTTNDICRPEQIVAGPPSYNYTFTTLAGLAGLSGSADGTGSNARFNDPHGVAVDSAGNLYVADTDNFTIRKITPGGVVSTLAGLAGFRGSADGTGANARFNDPCGVAADSAGSIYVADFWNYTIRQITPGGVVRTLAGLAGSPGSADGTGTDAQFSYPYGVAVDSAGNIYVADCSNNTIRLGRVAPAPPLLCISPSGGQTILSWPLEASNFLVEASSTLLPAPCWMPLTSAVGTSGNCCILTNRVETGARFFRLRLP